MATCSLMALSGLCLTVPDPSLLPAADPYSPRGVGVGPPGHGLRGVDRPSVPAHTCAWRGCEAQPSRQLFTCWHTSCTRKSCRSCSSHECRTRGVDLGEDEDHVMCPDHILPYVSPPPPPRQGPFPGCSRCKQLAASGHKQRCWQHREGDAGSDDEDWYDDWYEQDARQRALNAQEAARRQASEPY